MGKCNLETDCHGAGKCCLDCNELCFCNHVCRILDEDKTRAELEEQMKKCDWFQDDSPKNEIKEEWIVELTESNSEIWGSDIDCSSRKEAIEKGMEAAKKEGLKSFRIGRQEYCGMAHIDVDAIIEDAQAQLYNEVGEASETYLEDVTKEQEKELEEALNEAFHSWHKKHKLFPNCYEIHNDEVIEVR